jgi:hypothetical protein
MSSAPSAPTEWGPEASHAELERILARVLAGITPVWIVDEQYSLTYGPIWRVTLALPYPNGQWVRRRYRYDVPSRTLYFAGEQPIDAAELASLRTSARRIA